MKNLIISFCMFALALTAALCMSCATGVKTPPHAGSIATGFEVAVRIMRVWPDLTVATLDKPGNIRLVDTKYYLPSYAEARAIIHWQKDWFIWAVPEYVTETHDCDDFAVETVIGVHRAYSGEFPVAFGLMDVTGHSLTILVCVEGVLVYDPMTDITRNAVVEDKPFFIRI